MTAFHTVCRTCLLSLSVAVASPAWAGGTVQLELVGDARGSALAFQEWARTLGDAGIRNVRIRAAGDSVNVGIEMRGPADSRTYVVTGIVRSANEVELPGGRYRRSDVGRLRRWLDDLAEHGPAARREPKGPFGLSRGQFAMVRAGSASPVGFATKAMTRRQAVRRIAKQLKLPLTPDVATAAALGDDPLAEELSRLSRGTGARLCVGFGRTRLCAAHVGASCPATWSRCSPVVTSGLPAGRPKSCRGTDCLACSSSIT